MHDVIIIGGGPAGLTAGIYLGRAGMRTLIIEKETIGGQIASSPLVENYPGVGAVSGSEIADKMYDQAYAAGVEFEIDEVVKIDGKKVICESSEYEGRAIIIATGSKYKTLGLKGESDLIGRGVHFCTSCDGPFYKDKCVAVVGGANTACVNALYLSKICKKVYLIYRGTNLKCEKKIYDEVCDKSNIEVLYESNVVEYLGYDELTGIIVNKNGEDEKINVDAVFLSIGMDAVTDFASDIVEVDESKYFKSEDTFTNVNGIFVAGDCRSKEVRQVTTAVSDGTLAAINVINYLRSIEKES